MGPNARTRLIRDRFIDGHPNCDLWQHLDSVLPDIPIQDIRRQIQSVGEPCRHRSLESC